MTIHAHPDDEASKGAPTVATNVCVAPRGGHGAEYVAFPSLLRATTAPAGAIPSAVFVMAKSILVTTQLRDEGSSMLSMTKA